MTDWQDWTDQVGSVKITTGNVSITGPVTINNTGQPQVTVTAPPVTTVTLPTNTGFFGRKVTLAGTGATTPVPVLGAGEHFTSGKWGVLVLGTTTNKGKRIWLTSKATGFSTNFFSFPAKGGVFVPMKKCSQLYLAGTLNDFAWVLAA